jgi:hypothetical protein
VPAVDMFRFKDIYYIFFLAGVICAFIAYRKNPRHLKYFAWFLLVTFVIDIAGGITARVYHARNHWIYNISISVEYEFLPFFYLFIIRSRLVRLITRGYLLLFPLLILVNYGYYGWNSYHTYTIITGSIFTVFLIVVYFKELLHAQQYINLFTEPVFWISVALLFYHVGVVPYIGMVNYLNTNYPAIASNYYYIVKVLNAVMYLLFTTAFLCRFNLRNSSPLS